MSTHNIPRLIEQGQDERIRALEAEVAGLRKDKAMLDWIDAQEQLAIRKGKYCSGTVRIYREDAALAHGLSVRGALDAAIQAEKGEAPS